MAERRMFAKTIIDSDAFLDMPVTSQLLYFHLSMRADDDGFVNKPKSIMRMIGAKDDDLKLLFLKKFLIPFESGIVVIKHWKIHNYIRNDRYKETKYKEELASLALDENNSYTVGIPSDTQMDTQVRLGKVRLGKESNIGDTRNARFTPPTLEEVTAYVTERQSKVIPQEFIDFYEAKGWMVGRTKMKDWKAACRNAEKWERWDKPHRGANGISISGEKSDLEGVF